MREQSDLVIKYETYVLPGKTKQLTDISIVTCFRCLRFYLPPAKLMDDKTDLLTF